VVFNPIAEAVTLQMKSCCMDRLESAIQKIANDDNPVASTSRSFHLCLLSDAKGVTVTSGKTSMARQGGLAYLQCYSQVKNNLDAHKYFPFSQAEKFSEILTLGTEERDKLRCSRHRFDVPHCRICFLRNLLRVESGYGSPTGCKKSRLEFRASLALYGEILSHLEAQNWPQVDPLRLEDSKPYFIFETVDLNTYILNRVNTTARFFQEIISIADDLGPAQQKLARTIMKLLKAAICGYPIDRVPILWKSKFRPKVQSANIADDPERELEEDVDEEDDLDSEFEKRNERRGQ